MMRALIAISAMIAVPVSAQTPAGPLNVRADHLAFLVADAEASLAFYTQVFGAEAIPVTFATTRWVRLGSIELHLIGERKAALDLPPQIHLALRTDDLDALTALLDARKIAWADFAGKPRTVQTRPDGVRQIFLRDPDGYWIEVNQKPKP